MLSYGSIAVALVQRRVMVVQGQLPPPSIQSFSHFFFFFAATRPHDECERYLDVYTFTPSSSSETGGHDGHGSRTFCVSDAPCARIDSNDLLAIFDDDEDAMTIPQDVLELPQKAYDEFSELSSSRKGARRFDAVWAAWKGKFR